MVVGCVAGKRWHLQLATNAVGSKQTLRIVVIRPALCAGLALGADVCDGPVRAEAVLRVDLF